MGVIIDGVRWLPMAPYNLPVTSLPRAIRIEPIDNHIHDLEDARDVLEAVRGALLLGCLVCSVSMCRVSGSFGRLCRRDHELGVHCLGMQLPVGRKWLFG